MTTGPDLSHAFAELAGALERRGTVDVDGVPHAIWLLDLGLDPRSAGSAIEVKVAARNPSGRHYIGRFRVDAERLAEDGLSLTLETIDQVIRRNLPPNARETLS